MGDWESVTVYELRTAAKVARCVGGELMVAAARAWEVRAEIIERKIANVR